MKIDLSGKKALVLASSKGIGFGIAEQLSHSGARVAIASHHEAQLSEGIQLLKNGLGILGDLSKPGEAARITSEAMNQLGGIDILVTNAPHPARGHFSDLSLDDWQSSFQGIFLSVIESVQVALPLMKKQKDGRIIMITSTAAKEPLPGMMTSSSFRSGLHGFMKSLALETAPFGITVNALLPGFTTTASFGTPAHQETYLPKIPVGKFAETSDHGNLATFLASPQAKMITGQTIAVDGGFLRSF